jgi:hypothetical protein
MSRDHVNGCRRSVFLARLLALAALIGAVATGCGDSKKPVAEAPDEESIAADKRKTEVEGDGKLPPAQGAFPNDVEHIVNEDGGMSMGVSHEGDAKKGGAGNGPVIRMMQVRNGEALRTDSGAGSSRGEGIGLQGLAKGEKPDPKRLPQVWKQHRGRPTIARVYVGDGNSLELVSLQVTATVDGPRARTIVDHVFHNPHARQLEGTFEYPLPTGASPSYYAMFPGKTRENVPQLFARRGQAPPLTGDLLASLKPTEMAHAVSTDDWGNLMESRVVNKEKALETYEEVTRRRIDPALLEYAGGNTFSGRVFPIPAKGFSRVIVAYEELMPIIGDKDVYRFKLPDSKLSEVVFTLQANAGNLPHAERSSLTSDTGPMKDQAAKCASRSRGPNRAFRSPAAGRATAGRFTSMPASGRN